MKLSDHLQSLKVMYCKVYWRCNGKFMQCFTASSGSFKPVHKFNNHSWSVLVPEDYQFYGSVPKGGWVLCHDKLLWFFSQSNAWLRSDQRNENRYQPRLCGQMRDENHRFQARQWLSFNLPKENLSLTRLINRAQVPILRNSKNETSILFRAIVTSASLIPKNSV